MTLAAELHANFIHARWPIQSYVVAGFLLGLLLALVPLSTTTIWAFFSWLLLCIGLTIFNSYYDKDEEPVGGMVHPPKVTEGLFWGSLITQMIALAIAVFISRTFFLLALFMYVVFFLYSHRMFRFKSNGYAAVFLNGLLGATTILAASSLGGDLSRPEILCGAATAFFFKNSVYIMMQVHQIEEDTLRGDRSIAVMYGRRKTLLASLVMILISGVFATSALYILSQGYLLPILMCGYFLSIAALYVLWMSRDGNKQKDTVRMNRMVYYTGYVGSVVFSVSYVYLHMRGML
ncbi:MAG TPA: UbiA family prenyltransferase [Candidatus Acidoferrales bacterium]|nr:UbiA family prenyltransferase [Candidatus Acidoferrales bacterium]HXK06961.1 UbiA family prenyltransferase [Verrucomicrobiae bacterium]